MSAAFLDVRGLTVAYGARPVLGPLDLTLEHGERIGIVGESGSGKSTLGLALLGLLPSSARVSGTVCLEGKTIDIGDERTMQTIRGRKIGFVCQEPMAAYSPIHRIGRHLADAVRAVRPDLGRSAVRARVIDLIERVGIMEAASRMNDYPVAMSGGMLQRITIAGALAGDPALLIADEPTTALDVRTQVAIIGLLDETLRRRNACLLLISHNLGLVQGACDRILVMRAGLIVDHILTASPGGARHPYTQALMAAQPRIGSGLGRLRTAKYKGEADSLAPEGNLP